MTAGPTYTSIATYTVPSPQNTYTFTSIPSTYTDLVLICTLNVADGNYPIIALRFNGDTASNYAMYGTEVNGVSGKRIFSISPLNWMYLGGTYNAITDAPAAFGTWEIHIQNYANTSYAKNALSFGGTPTNSTTIASTSETDWAIGSWTSTAAINSVTITTNNGSSFNVNSTFDLYGIKAA